MQLNGNKSVGLNLKNIHRVFLDMVESGEFDLPGFNIDHFKSLTVHISKEWNSHCAYCYGHGHDENNCATYAIWRNRARIAGYQKHFDDLE